MRRANLPAKDVVKVEMWWPTPSGECKVVGLNLSPVMFVMMKDGTEYRIVLEMMYGWSEKIELVEEVA